VDDVIEHLLSLIPISAKTNQKTNKKLEKEIVQLGEKKP
jgi:DNA-directed RNA polymerase alpha subunit